MLSFLYTTVVFLAVLGVMVLIHELGHFLVARRVNVKVLEFSLGLFGPVLYRKKVGETEYLIKTVPFGGYVKMLGESSEDMEQEDITPEDIERSFANQTPLKRFCIIFAGPFMNIVLAMILAPLFYMVGIKEPAYLKKLPVVDVIEKESAAERAGLIRNDLILEIDDKKVSNWEEVKQTIMLSPEISLKLKVRRGNETVPIIMTPDKDEHTKAGIAGLVTYPNIVGAVSKGYPAEKAGIMTGDRILSINGKPVSIWGDITPAINSVDTEVPVPVVISRNGEEKNLSIVPIKDGERLVVGINPLLEQSLTRYGFFEAIKMGLKYVKDNFFLIFVVLKKLIIGELSLKSVGGPILIAQVTGSALALGISHLIRFMALISINFGVINLLPLPALDGGHIMFSLAEFISRRKLNPKRLDLVNTIGFVMLITLMVVITFIDIDRILRAKGIYDKLTGLF